MTFRTLDLGGDKILPYADPVPEENPAIGWRAIRIGLTRPGMLRYQVRALLQAGAGKNLRVMFPMVAVVSEFMTAKNLLLKELARLDGVGRLVLDVDDDLALSDIFQTRNHPHGRGLPAARGTQKNQKFLIGNG